MSFLLSKTADVDYLIWNSSDLEAFFSSWRSKAEKLIVVLTEPCKSQTFYNTEYHWYEFWFKCFMNGSLIDMRLSPTFQEHPPAHFAFRIPRYRWFPAYGECVFFILAVTSKSELGTDIVCELLIESRGLNLQCGVRHTKRWDIRKGKIYKGRPSCGIINSVCMFILSLQWCVFVGTNFHFSYLADKSHLEHHLLIIIAI